MACARFSRSINTMTELIAWLVALLALKSPLALAATFAPRTPSEYSSHAGNLDEGISVDLLHYHHVDSPYAMPNLTMAERIKFAVQSSQARIQFFHEKIYGSKSPMFGSSKILFSPVYPRSGMHVMEFSLGTKPQKFLGMLDTGSDLTWVFRVGAKVNMRDHPLTPKDRFDPDKSKSFRTVPYHNDPHCSALSERLRRCSSEGTCQYEENYSDNSTVFGDVALETLTLTSTHGVTHGFPNFPFASLTEFSDKIILYAVALVGLGQGPLSLVSQIGPNIKNIFSYCLVNMDSEIDKSSLMLLGSAGKIPLHYTTLVTNVNQPTFYYLDISGILIAGVPLSYPPAAFAIDPQTGLGGMILDSGTTITVLFKDVYEPFVERLKSLIKYDHVIDGQVGLKLCYFPGLDVVHPDFPEVVFQFAGKPDVSLHHKNLFRKAHPHAHYCLQVEVTYSHFSVFGNVQQQDHVVAYDRGGNRVGFAPHTC